MKREYQVIIIGAGHAGLSASYFLKRAGIDHLVLERGQIAYSWKTQRWDSFNLVLPNWTLKLPGHEYDGSNPDGFLSLIETVDYIENYARIYQLPICHSTQVNNLTFESSKFVVSTSGGQFQARNVVVATGPFHDPYKPEFSEQVSPRIRQLHSADYKNPGQLAEGATLVVGTGQSGVQIAEEVHATGKKTFLSVSRCGGRPRRYRGKDCVWWMEQFGFYDQPPSTLRSSQDRFNCNVPLTGYHGGYDINLRGFQKNGIYLVGSIKGIKQDMVEVSPNLDDNLQFADEEWNRFLQKADVFAAENELNLPEEPEAYLKKSTSPSSLINKMNLAEEGITNIIWSTGFRLNFKWIKIPIFDEIGFPDSNEGTTKIPGLYFLGLPWQRKRKSSIILGAAEDAKAITSNIISNLKI